MKDLRNIIQDCNLNFLIGSGLSSPYLPTLGNIETLLTQLDKEALPPPQDKLIRCSIYKQYFDAVIFKNLGILNSDAASAAVFEGYRDFLAIISALLLQRKSTILSKQANIFTTNIDVFLDKTLEELRLEYNDGFNGRFTPRFSLSNFKKSRFMTSLHYDNTSEMPVFNLLKLHGSLCWEMDSNHGLVFSSALKQVREVSGKASAIGAVLPVDCTTTIASLITSCGTKSADGAMSAFLDAYEELLIVNPTKDKFKDSILNQNYYELLRIYSNELEKENTVLFVMGFSFADEHIRKITLRSANSNPTLMVYIVAYNSQAAADIRNILGTGTINNRNVSIVSPDVDKGVDLFTYDLPTMNQKLWKRILED